MLPIKKNIGVVVAHYDEDGLIRPDLLSLLDSLEKVATRVVLVSTNLSSATRRIVPSGVQIISRPNIGYDFYSYKLGIDEILKNDNIDRLLLVNSSFFCVDTGRLMENFILNEHKKSDFFGLTESHQIKRHLQSFLLSFSLRCHRSNEFRRWWENMVPLNSRQDVIDQYELGLTSYLVSCGFKYRSAYNPSIIEQVTAFLRALKSLKLVLNPKSLNPMHFYWDFILEKYGIIKIELLKSNPNRINLASTKEII